MGIEPRRRLSMSFFASRRSRGREEGRACAMLLASRLRNVQKLISNRHACLEYLNSPRRSIAFEVLQKGSLPCDILVDQGTTSEEEQNFLRKLVRESSGASGPIVEIGTLFGFTTSVLALAKKPERKLITVDSFTWNPWGLSPAEHRRLTERVLHVATQVLNVELIVSDKKRFYDSYTKEAPSLVFLDAIHTYEETKADIAWSMQAGCRFIAGHDYSLEFPGVVKAVNEVAAPEVRDTLWAIRVGS